LFIGRHTPQGKKKKKKKKKDTGRVHIDD